jgi:hypothetical protein
MFKRWIELQVQRGMPIGWTAHRIPLDRFSDKAGICAIVSRSAGAQILTDGAPDGLGDADVLICGAEQQIALELGIQAH